MCYNVAYLEKRGDKYAERYKDAFPEGYVPPEGLQTELPMYYFVSGFSYPELPIVKHDGIFLYNWGLIPAWCKDTKQANEMGSFTLNAVGDTVFDKPSFNHAIKKQRCLLGVNGFYEWRDVAKVKYPYFIKSSQHEIFSLGCIYEHWVDKETGEVSNTFSIVTTAANPMMEKIHNLKKRMPLIIEKENEKDWINQELSTDEIKTLIKPYPQENMSAYTVSKMVNSAKNYRNVPEALEKVEYAELD
jgi:putative SOS response-associated peptidase YedK